jgi:hypothetical protein
VAGIRVAPERVGLVMTIGGLAGLAFNAPAGALVDRTGLPRLWIAGSAQGIDRTRQRDAMDGGGVVVAQLTMVPIAIPAAVQRRNLTALGLALRQRGQVSSVNAAVISARV